MSVTVQQTLQPSSPHSQQPRLINEQDLNYIRIKFIHFKASTRVLHFLFLNGSSSRDPNESLFEYYQRNGITTFQRGLYDEQKERINTDPQGNSFDITLLCRCLRKGSHGLAPDNDEKWIKDDRTSIESLIYIVKNRRNILCHEVNGLPNQQLIDEAEDLRDILKQILDYSKTIYNLSSAIIDNEKARVDFIINNYLHEDFEPKTKEEYENLVFFVEQANLVNIKGVKETFDHYDRNAEDELQNDNHLININVSLDKVYTKMKLKEGISSDQVKEILYEEILHDDMTGEQTKMAVVINGVAGAGKTTITKNVVQDWRKNEGKMKHLENHHHVFKYECRNTAVKTFDDLLFYFMPNTSKSFRTGDLKKVILSQRVLVILDGLDELNDSSIHLFDDLLNLKKAHDIALIITTRPEKMIYLEKKLASHSIGIKQIQLLGVSIDKRNELVTKYHNEIAKQYPMAQEITGLLRYLEETGLRLAEVWRLPYNLILVTLLWAYNHMSVAKINTAPELYREILELYKIKLRERLRDNENTRNRGDDEINNIINLFLCNLASESLKGLMDDHINLSEERYHKLAKLCRRLCVPVEEMLSAFLKRTAGSQNIYEYPHKGLQDYLAAYCILSKIKGREQSIDADETMQIITSALSKTKLSGDMIDRFTEYMETEIRRDSNISNDETSIISSILEKVNESSIYDVSKLQNMIICLLGMFFDATGNSPIDEKIQLETLQILQKTGVYLKSEWINILSDVKCNDFVASFINEKADLLEGNITLSDSSVSAYVCLMNGLQVPFKKADQVTFDLDIQDLKGDKVSLLHLISLHQFKVRKIFINRTNVSDYEDMMNNIQNKINHEGITIELDDELTNIKELLRIFKVKNYRIICVEVRGRVMKIKNEHLDYFGDIVNHLELGTLTIDLDLPGDFRNPQASLHLKSLESITRRSNIKEYCGQLLPGTSPETFSKVIQLCLSVPNTGSFLTLRQMILFNKLPRLEGLRLSISLNIDMEQIISLPGNLEFNYPKGGLSLFIPDVTEHDCEKVVAMAHRLQPTEGRYQYFDSIYFPRCSMDIPSILRLLQGMKLEGIRLNGAIVFPIHCAFSSSQSNFSLSSSPSPSYSTHTLPSSSSNLTSSFSIPTNVQAQMNCTGYRIIWGTPGDRWSGSIYDMGTW